MTKKKGNQFICQHLISKGFLITKDLQTGAIYADKNYYCELKNICLNNIYCGFCNCFKHIDEPEIEFCEIVEQTI